MNNWQEELDRLSNRRCDYGALIQDALRHRTQLRDFAGEFGPYQVCSRVFDLDCSTCELIAPSLLALHLVLDAYGFGSATAILVVDNYNTTSRSSIPSLIDHIEIANDSCDEVVRQISELLGQKNNWSNPNRLSGRGDFDAVTILCRDEIPEDAISAPLVFGVSILTDGSGLKLQCRFSRDLISPNVPLNLLDSFGSVLHQIVTCPERRIAQLIILSASEQAKIEIFTNSTHTFDTNVRLEQLFERVARDYPEAMSICTDEYSLSFKQLNTRCNRVARYLATEKIGNESGALVGLYFDKCPLSVITTLALWKSGGGCVPIDPKHPMERVLAIVEETRLTTMIANVGYVVELREAFERKNLPIKVIAVEAISEMSSDFAGDDLGLDAPSTQTAYVMYTSGTTGTPKCVAKPHISVVNSIIDLSERYGMTTAVGSQRVALFSGFGFEPFMRQLLLALTNAQCLVIVPDSIRLDPDRLPEFLARHRVTYFSGTGSVLRVFDLAKCHTLERLALVGEELTTGLLADLRHKFGGIIFNEYAFTEATFVTALKRIDPGVSVRKDRSIGRPLRNVAWFVLDRHRRQVPIGAIGQLHVAGRGLADGYLNNPMLSSIHFFTNPFAFPTKCDTSGNGLIYGTGDLARMLPSGEVEFLGRNDFQLKINGVRVEPGEIEGRVEEYPGIRKCVVLPEQRAGNIDSTRLLAFYTIEQGHALVEAELISFLKSRLLQVMIPSQWFAIDNFPVTSIGKVDWRALLKIYRVSSSNESVATADCKDSESLRSLWGELLGIPILQIIDSNCFFRLGGQSLDAIKLVARVRKELHRDLKVEDVFCHSEFKALAEYLAKQPEIIIDKAKVGSRNSIPSQTTIRRTAHGLQQGLYYQSVHAESGDDTYVLQVLHRYQTAIRADLMELAWRQAYARFPALQLRFQIDGSPVQVIDPMSQPMDWNYSDLIGDSQCQSALKKICQQARITPFNIETGPLFRVGLLRENRDKFTLVFTCHHIILDGWSLSLLHEDVHRTYLDLLDGRPIQTQLQTTYLEAIDQWDLDHIVNEPYWSERVNSIEGGCDLRGLLKTEVRGQVELSGYARVKDHQTHQFNLSKEFSAGLRRRCADLGLTVHSALQFALHTALYAFGGGAQTVVGTVVAGRAMPVPNIEQAVGLFINTLPIIVEHARSGNDQTVAEAMVEIQRATTSLNDHSSLNFAEIKTDGPKARLFDALMMYENLPLSEEELQQKERLKFDRSRDVNKVDHHLQLVARENDEQLEVCLWFAGEIFDPAMISRFMATIRLVLQQVARDANLLLGDLALVDRNMETELNVWNDTGADLDGSVTLIDIFEAITEQWATEPAVAYKGTKLCYSELDVRANQLAHAICANVKPGSNDKIAIVMEKSDWMISAILAVWKAGAAYVPVDPSYPDSRIEFILQDTEALLVVVDPSSQDKITKIIGSVETPGLLVPQLVNLAEYPTSPMKRSLGSSDLAYAIYTSGTTGLPKAVLVAHSGVVNLQQSLARRFVLSRSDARHAFLSFSNFVFDHFVEQMTDALLNGQLLVVLDDNLRTDNVALCECIRTHEVSYLSGTPSVLSMYDYSNCPSLRFIDAVGEDFTPHIFRRLRSSFSGVIINGYGPTEISITSHKRPYEPATYRDDRSIGMPVENTTSYVLDGCMRRIPVGGIGELYIGGAGVTCGYLGRSDLTAERFLQDKYAEQSKVGAQWPRVYRTGDLCRWLPNGEIEYFGRVDNQLKVNGQRIEPAEIECALLQHADVDHAVVLVHDPKAKHAQLVGFYASSTGLSATDLVAWLRTRLPAGMMPVRLIEVEQIPVTPSGKLDVQTLRALNFNDTFKIAEPNSALEKQLLQIWANILETNVSLVGVEDNFFALGGDSLRAIRLAAIVTTRLQRKLTLPAVFENLTIRSQALHLSNPFSKPYESSVLARMPEETGSPLTSSQIALKFLNESSGETSAFNIPLFVQIDSRCVSAAMIKPAIGHIVERHAVLRTRFTIGPGGTSSQDVLSTEFVCQQLDFTPERSLSKTAMDEKFWNLSQRVFDLEADLPFYVRLHSCDETPNYFYLAFVAHHICFDGLSLAILWRELVHLAGGRSTSALTQPMGTYVEFATREYKKVNDIAFDASLSVLRKEIEHVPSLSLPTDAPRPNVFDHRGFDTDFQLSVSESEGLKALARASKTSLYTVLLAVTALLLNTFSRQGDFAIGSPFSNRLDPEFDETIGLFANLVVLRIGIENDMPLSTFLAILADRVLNAAVHQDIPFDRLVKCLGIEPNTNRHPLCQAVLSVLPPGVESNNDNENISTYHPDFKGRANAKFDFHLVIFENSDGLAARLTLPTALFEQATAESLIASFKFIAVEMAEADLSVARLRDMRRACCNDKPKKFLEAQNCSSSLSDLFRIVVKNNENAMALVYREKCLTYAALNHAANCLANGLITAGVASGERIALLMDRTEAVVIAILAIWKVGCSYVPLDPAFPDDRIAFILKDADVAKVLSDCANGARAHHVAAGQVDTLINSAIEVDNACIPNRIASEENTAYVIYTSGSTGTPKGVRVTHANVLSFCEALAERHFSSMQKTQQAVLLTSNIVFDFSIEQLCLSILSGHRLIIPLGNIPDDNAYDYFVENQLSYLSGTPTQIAQFDLDRLPCLRWILLAGETIKPDLYQSIRDRFGGTIFTAYGTTETAVYNTMRQFEQNEAFANDLGSPLSNTQLMVLGPDHGLAPTGALGELKLSGPCVTDGYLNRDELTQQRFSNGLTPSDHSFLTGDIVRRHPNGNLEFWGREDGQVKIRGLRIETGEIEAALLAHQGIVQCLVVVDTGPAGRGQLVSYYRSKDDIEVTAGDIEAHLRLRLPATMMPAQIIHFKGLFPTTIAGKLDVNAVRELSYLPDVSYTSPRSPVEAQIAQLYRSLLNQNDPSIDTHFFRAGGDSISALHLAAALRDHFGTKVNVKAVFDHPTIRQLAVHLSNAASSSAVPRLAETNVPEVTGPLRPTPIQEWFLSKKLVNPGFWNQEFAFETPVLDPVRLQTALEQLVQRHDAFALRFRSGTHEFAQMVAIQREQVGIYLHQLDIANMSSKELRSQLDAWQNSFHLDAGPIATAAYLTGISDGSSRVWLAMHHMIVDRVSWDILCQDLETLYHGRTLGSRSASFCQWAQAFRAMKPNQSDSRFWQRVAGEVLADQPNCLSSRIADTPHTAMFEASKECLAGLQNLAAIANAPEMRDLLLAATGIAFCKLCQQDSIHIAIETHGREEIDAMIDVSSTVGWFTAIHPVCVEHNTPLYTAEQLKKSREEISLNGLGYGMLGTLGGPDAPLPLISFNYLGRFFGQNESPNHDTRLGAWRLDPEMMGLAMCPKNRQSGKNTIDVTCWISDNSLFVTVDSNLGKADIKQILEDMETSLTILSADIEETSLSSAPNVTEFDPVVLVENDPKAPSLYILPPGEGGAESYLGNISPHLRSLNQTLFNNIHLVHPKQNFAAVGSYYLDLIERQQPRGPYNLMGWSFGGVASLEIALQLARKGKTVNNLILIDPFFRLDLAGDELSLPDISNVIDPINLSFVPQPDDVKLLIESLERITFFKATAGLNDGADELQRKVFEYYAKTTCNHLDSIVPQDIIDVYEMGVSSHFSWVNDEATVAQMGALITALVGKRDNKGESNEETKNIDCAQNRHERA